MQYNVLTKILRLSYFLQKKKNRHTSIGLFTRFHLFHFTSVRRFFFFL